MIEHPEQIEGIDSFDGFPYFACSGDQEGDFCFSISTSENQFVDASTARYDLSGYASEVLPKPSTVCVLNEPPVAR